jgi:hypothetical protein
VVWFGPRSGRGLAPALGRNNIVYDHSTKTAGVQINVRAINVLTQVLNPRLLFNVCDHGTGGYGGCNGYGLYSLWPYGRLQHDQVLRAKECQ